MLKQYTTDFFRPLSGENRTIHAEILDKIEGEGLTLEYKETVRIIENYIQRNSLE